MQFCNLPVASVAQQPTFKTLTVASRFLRRSPTPSIHVFAGYNSICILRDIEEANGTSSVASLYFGCSSAECTDVPQKWGCDEEMQVVWTSTGILFLGKTLSGSKGAAATSTYKEATLHRRVAWGPPCTRNREFERPSDMQLGAHSAQAPASLHCSACRHAPLPNIGNAPSRRCTVTAPRWQLQACGGLH